MTERVAGPGRIFRMVVSALFRVILPLVVLAAAVLGARRMMETAPKAPRGAAVRAAKLVEVVEAVSAPRGAEIEAMGVVRPARKVNLAPQVPGRVEWVAPDLVPGGRLAAGVPLVRIERKDYEIAVAQREAEKLVAEASVVEAGRRVTQTERDLRIEEGNQAVARSELEAFGQGVDPGKRDLVLRVPQLEAARAEVEAARAGVASAKAALDGAALRVERAKLDLDRTAVAAPFDVVVEDDAVEVGDLVSAGQPLAKLMGTDEFWVEISLPAADLRFVEVPAAPGGRGSEVRLADGRTGFVLRLLPTVDERGRMARLLVSVPDPLDPPPGAAGPPLLVGSYVRATVIGRPLEALVALPRPFLRDGDRTWVMTPDARLSIRSLDVAYRGRDEVLVRAGLAAGERIVTTDIAAPVDGMPLRVSGPGPTGVER